MVGKFARAVTHHQHCDRRVCPPAALSLGQVGTGWHIV